MIAELVSGAVALALYLNTLNADFCYDDSRAIKTNQDLLPETPWTNILYNDFWGTLLTHSGSHKSFRPLCTLSFRLNYTLGGLDPWGYHLLNVCLHCCVTALFTALTRPLLGGAPWSALAGLLFASHPIHTEAVAGLVGRADVGAGLCFLLSLLCYTRHCRLRPSAGRSPQIRWRAWAWLLGSLLTAAVAMLWKEQGVTVLAVSAVYDLCVVHRMRLWQVLSAFHKRKNISLLVSLTWLAGWGMLLLSARLYWMGNKPPQFSNSDNPAADSPHLLTRTLTFLYLPAANTWLLLCPHTLSFDWSMDAIPLLKNFSDWRNFYSVAFYLGITLLAWFGLRNKDSVMLHETNGKYHTTNGKSMTNGHSLNHLDENHYHSSNHHSNGLTPLAFTENRQNGCIHSQSSSSHTSLPSKENMVVFSLGLLTLPFLPATNLFFYVGFVIAERVLYIPSMGFCLLVTLGLRSMCVHARQWSFKALLVSCTAGLVLLYSAKTMCRNQDWQSEEMLYRSGITVNPAKAWGNLGNVLKNQGKMAEAEEAYRNALYYRGNMADMLYNLGLLLQESERFSEALHYYKLAIGSRPTLASAYLNTGIILVSQGNMEEAKHTFQTCAGIPDDNLKDPNAHKSSVTSCLYNLGKILHEQGLQEEALFVYKDAIKKMPHQFAPQSLYNMMGEAYMRLNKFEEAGFWYKESLKAKPDHVPAHLTYGKLLSIMGQTTEAEHYFLKAIELEPTKGNCYMHYGQFLLEQSRFGEAAVMAEKAAELDTSEFDVVFSAAHMLRSVQYSQIIGAVASSCYRETVLFLGNVALDKMLNAVNARLNEAAERYYVKAADLRPNYAAALMNLGAILHLNGKLQDAEAHYLRALQLKPDDLITQSNLRKLWNMMNKQGLNSERS